MIARNRGNTAEFVRQQLLNDLRDGKILPGDKLITENLARRYDVSRTPVREALISLEHDGLLEATTNSGYEVRTLTLPELCELYEIREALEGLAVVKLIEKGVDDELIAQLRQCCEQRRSAATFDEKMAGDRRLHALICDSCGSESLRKLIHNYLMLSNIFNMSDRLLRGRSDATRRNVHQEHEAIIAAIAAKNASRARKLLVAHIAGARATLMKLISK